MSKLNVKELLSLDEAAKRLSRSFEEHITIKDVLQFVCEGSLPIWLRVNKTFGADVENPGLHSEVHHVLKNMEGVAGNLSLPNDVYELCNLPSPYYFNKDIFRSLHLFAQWIYPEEKRANGTIVTIKYIDIDRVEKIYVLLRPEQDNNGQYVYSPIVEHPSQSDLFIRPPDLAALEAKGGAADANDKVPNQSRVEQESLAKRIKELEALVIDKEAEIKQLKAEANADADADVSADNDIKSQLMPAVRWTWDTYYAPLGIGDKQPKISAVEADIVQKFTGMSGIQAKSINMVARRHIGSTRVEGGDPQNQQTTEVL